MVLILIVISAYIISQNILFYNKNHTYDITLPVKDIRKINEQKIGEKGLRYTCTINGKDRHVFLDMERFDRYRWYVESIEPEPEDYAE